MKKEVAFSEVLEHLQDGGKATRKAWSDGFIFLVPGSTFTVNREPLLGIYPEGAKINYQPHIDIATSGNVVSVWTPTQVDMSADDWICR